MSNLRQSSGSSSGGQSFIVLKSFGRRWRFASHSYLLFYAVLWRLYSIQKASLHLTVGKPSWTKAYLNDIALSWYTYCWNHNHLLMIRVLIVSLCSFLTKISFLSSASHIALIVCILIFCLCSNILIDLWRFNTLSRTIFDFASIDTLYWVWVRKS